ncbi:hypothetical protein [Robiginitomaculum antarcticum]|uniref:hypothetical protein n=1 Tax=Robiginitomaculum antarcticum TaxID=437507 RepID=UPI000371BDCC|nr:hypothetical protein [Robiginitomaculum antarcticum]
MKIKLHIGANKTGSSAIQRFIRMNAANFQKFGVTVPDVRLNDTGVVTGEHSFLFESFLEDDYPGVQLREKLQMLAKRGYDTIAISAESLSNEYRADYFGPIFAEYDTEVLLYIRRQDDLLLSTWQQWSSKRETNVDDWLERAKVKIGRWDSLIRSWEEYIASDQINVKLFERREMKNQNITHDAFDFFLGDADPVEFDFSVGEVNPSFSDLIVPLVSGNENIFKNVHDNGFYELVRELTGDQFISGKRVSLISQGERERLLSSFAEGNEWVRSHYFPEKELLFSPLDHSRYAYYSKEEMLTEQMRFLTTMIASIGKRFVTHESKLN